MQNVTAYTNFTNNNTINVHNCATIAEFEALLQQRNITYTLREECGFPVYVYVNNENYVAFYDEEQEHGYVA